MTSDEQEEPLAALSGLLALFRQGNIIAPEAEREGMKQHAGSLNERWDENFPNFPAEYFPYTSFRGQYYRGRRDAYLKDIIVRLLARCNPTSTVVVNPACVFGRHARDLASRLANARVIGTDIDPVWNRLYRVARAFHFPANYSFVKDNIFEPTVDARPTAVVFFGACGAVTDGALDYAINSGARYLMCRTCCHDNIGGNAAVIKRPDKVNRFFRFKNWTYRRMRTRARYAGYYFADRYSNDAYPRSDAARRVSTSDEFQAIARHSADSDICRAIIDLDRYLYLMENEFSVFYQGELFVAERRV